MLRKLARLSAARRRLLLESWARLAGASLAVRVLPTSAVLRMWSAADSHCSKPAAAAASVEDVSWSVRAAARFVPGATCLPQAIVARRMLMSLGYGAEFHLGVQMGGERPFHAHAWVVSEGRIVAGEAAMAGYTPLRESPSQLTRHTHEHTRPGIGQ